MRVGAAVRADQRRHRRRRRGLRARARLRRLRARRSRGRARCAGRPSTSASTAWSRATTSTGSTRVFAYAKRAQAARGRAACASSRRGAARAPTRRCAAPTRSTARSCRRSSKLARKHRLRVRLDCSYTPMVAHHRIDAEAAALAGHLRLHRRRPARRRQGDGRAHRVQLRAAAVEAPASTASATTGSATDAFGAFRRWREAAAEPCRSCEYLALCRGGCRVVSAHVAGDATAPDPECPRVQAWRAEHRGATPRHLPVVG